MIHSSSARQLAVQDQRRTLMRAERLELLNTEAEKGCSPFIAPHPVSLEPSYTPLDGRELLPRYEYQHPNIRRLRVWLSPDEPFRWDRCELLLKTLSGALGRLGFEVSGNRDGISLILLCTQADTRLLQTAFISEYPQSILRPDDADWMDANPLQTFTDYYPEPPYFHQLSTVNDFSESPLMYLYTLLRQLPAEAIGLFQCLFQPAWHPWRRNVAQLQDWQYLLKLGTEDASNSRFPQQLPSGELHQVATAISEKTPNVSPLYFTTVRTALFGSETINADIEFALGKALSMYRHGGRPLCQLTHEEYALFGVEREKLRQMLRQGMSLRHGFLVNSGELATLSHLPPVKEIAERELPFELLESLLPDAASEPLGTRIGLANIAGQMLPVKIPPRPRKRATHLIAASGMGKSTVMVNMFLQDTADEDGAVFIDPHGDALRDIVANMTESQRKKCLYVDPSDPEWTPLWNPLARNPSMDRYRHADDLLSAFERVSRDWGDRMAYVLRNGLIGLSFVPGATMHDLYNLTRRGSEQSKRIIERIVEECADEAVRRFWRHDFGKNYREADLASPRHKLHKLISGGPVSTMLGQSASRLDFRRAMDEGAILLVDLSRLGTEARSILGAFTLTLFMMAALSRSDTARGDRRPFAIYADEAYQFISRDALENLITQARKFGVNLVLANQYLSQFKKEQIDALSTVGTTIIGKLDKHDSQYFTKDLQDKVKAVDLMQLKPYEFIARIESEVVRFQSEPLEHDWNQSAWDAVVSHSRRKLYQKTSELSQSGLAMCRTLPDWRNYFTEEDLHYDTFE